MAASTRSRFNIELAIMEKGLKMGLNGNFGNVWRELADDQNPIFR
jgi:hypothetical protein